MTCLRCGKRAMGSHGEPWCLTCGTVEPPPSEDAIAEMVASTLPAPGRVRRQRVARMPTTSKLIHWEPEIA